HHRGLDPPPRGPTVLRRRLAAPVASAGLDGLLRAAGGAAHLPDHLLARPGRGLAERRHGGAERPDPPPVRRLRRADPHLHVLRRAWAGRPDHARVSLLLAAAAALALPTLLAIRVDEVGGRRALTILTSDPMRALEIRREGDHLIV